MSDDDAQRVPADGAECCVPVDGVSDGDVRRVPADGAECGVPVGGVNVR